MTVPYTYDDHFVARLLEKVDQKECYKVRRKERTESK